MSYFLFFFLALSIAAAIFAGPDCGKGSFIAFGYLITAGREFKTDLGSLGSAVGYFW